MYHTSRDDYSPSSSISTDPENDDQNTDIANTGLGSEPRGMDQYTLPTSILPVLGTQAPDRKRVGMRSLRDKQNSSQAKGSISDEAADEILMRLSNVLPPIVEKDADTLIYLGIPPQEPGQDSFDYQYIRSHFKQPYLMRSETLRRVNSAKFEKCLGPMSARTERRLKKLEVHKLVSSVEKINYYIDLSPVLNDEEAMTQLAEMSVPREALRWHQAARQYGVSQTQVAGRDTFRLPRQPYQVQSKINDVNDENYGSEFEDDDKSGKAQKGALKQKQKTPQASQPLELPLEEEYTSLRHHTTVSRLLHAIAGNDPKLNSAAKAWSFCMLAKYFECAHSHIILPWIESWLLQGQNVNFIQVNPYTAYRMGMAMHSIWLVRSTFAILVGKRALDNALPATRAARDGSLCNTSLFGGLDDDEKNRIDHASAALQQRMKHSFEQLMLCLWMGDSKSVRELNGLQVSDHDAMKILEDIKSKLVHFVRRRICIAITQNAEYGLPDGDHAIFLTEADIDNYNKLSLNTRILTQSFWKILRARSLDMDFQTDEVAVSPAAVASINRARLINSIIDIPFVSRYEITNLIYQFNHIRYPEQYLSSLDQRTPPKVRKTVRYDSPGSSSKAVELLVSDDPLTERVTGGDIPWSWSYRNEDGAKSDYNQLLDVLQAAKGIPPGKSTKKVLTRAITEGVDPAKEDSTSWFDGNTAEEKSEKVLQTENDFQVQAEYAAMWAEQAPGLSAPDHLEAVNSQLSRTSKRSIDAVDQDERFILDTDQNPGGAYREIYSTQNAPITLPHRYRANIAAEGIVPQAPTINRQETDQVQATATATAIARALTSRDSWAEEQPFFEMFDDSITQVHKDPPLQTYGNPTSPYPPQPPHEDKSPGELYTYTPEDIIYPSAVLQSLDSAYKYAISPLITPGYMWDGTCDFDIPTSDIKTLLCLSEDEWKYLPLWAGGLDDGSGGVFNDGAEIPDAPDVEDGGFRGGAMGIIPGIGSSLGGSMAGSEFEDIMTDVGVSTVGKASRLATDGEETVMSMDE